MKIGILTRAPRSYSTRRLREAALARGHRVRCLDTLAFSVSLRQGTPDLAYRAARLRTLDAVIPRIGPSITFYGAAVVRQFEQMGVFTLNSSHAISISRDKLRALQVFSRHSIGIPQTAFVRDRRDVLAAIERIGGVPVVIKLLEGPEGAKVIEAESTKMAQAIIETLQSANQNVLLQKVPAKGRMVRAVVVGGHVVAAVRRKSKKPVRLTPETERTAIHAAQILGLRVAGVDLIRTEDGAQVFEVSSSPGLGPIERATGADVAGAIIAHVEEHALFPEVDLKQRLTLEKGYGVAEIPVGPDSELLGKRIDESGLIERDVQVLRIERGGRSLPSPRGETRLEPGDELLCFGKLITLRSLIPQDPKGRSRKRTGKRAAAKR